MPMRMYRNGAFEQCRAYASEKAEEFDDDQLKLILASAYFDTRDYEDAGNLYYEVADKDFRHA